MYTVTVNNYSTSHTSFVFKKVTLNVKKLLNRKFQTMTMKQQMELLEHRHIRDK